MIADFTRFVPLGHYRPDGSYIMDRSVTDDQVKEDDRKLEAILRDCPVRLYDGAGREASVCVEQACNFEFICVIPYPYQPIKKIRTVRAMVDGYIEFKRPEPEEIYRDGRLCIDVAHNNYFIIEIVERGKPTFFIHTMNPFIPPFAFNRARISARET